MIDVNLDQRINAILDYVGDTGKQIVDFSAEQIPLLVKEVITWGIVEHMFYATACLITVIFLLLAIRFFMNKFRQNISGDPFGWGMGIFLLSVLSCGACVGITSNVTLAAKAYFAPRLYLIDWVIEKTKGHPCQ